jgi:hypothetical protein
LNFSSGRNARGGQNGVKSAAYKGLEAPNSSARQAENARISGQKRVKMLELGTTKCPGVSMTPGRNSL